MHARWPTRTGGAAERPHSRPPSTLKPGLSWCCNLPALSKSSATRHCLQNLKTGPYNSTCDLVRFTRACAPPECSRAPPGYRRAQSYSSARHNPCPTKWHSHSHTPDRPTPSHPDKMSAPSEYELQREMNIARNNLKLKELGTVSPKLRADPNTQHTHVRNPPLTIPPAHPRARARTHTHPTQASKTRHRRRRQNHAKSDPGALGGP